MLLCNTDVPFGAFKHWDSGIRGGILIAVEAITDGSLDNLQDGDSRQAN